MIGQLKARLPKLAAGLALATVAAVTGRISYTHIYSLTLALHQPHMVAVLMPFGVDGLMVVGSVILLDATEVDWWLGWLGVGPGAAVSLFANVESGIKYGWLAAAWAGVPAVAFALSTFMLERWLKAQAAKPAAALAEVPASEPASAPSAELDAPDAELDAPDALAPDALPAASNGHSADAHRVQQECSGDAVPSLRKIQATLECGQKRATQVQAEVREMRELALEAS